MKSWLIIVAVLLPGMACEKSAYSSIEGNDRAEPKAEAGKCPDGADLVGDPPPKGTLLECWKSDSTGERMRHGLSTKWYPHGQKARESSYKDGEKHGKETYWFGATGQKSAVQEYKDGSYHGKWMRWHANGQKAFEGEYEDGSQVGKWTFWHANGQKRSEGEYRDGEKRGKWACWDTAGGSIKCSD